MICTLPCSSDNVTIETAAVSPQEVNLTLYYEERINFNCSITQHHPKKEVTIVYYNTTLLINNQTIPDLDLHPYTTYLIECIDGMGDLCLEAMANVTTEEDSKFLAMHLFRIIVRIYVLYIYYYYMKELGVFVAIIKRDEGLLSFSNMNW